MEEILSIASKANIEDLVIKYRSDGDLSINMKEDIMNFIKRHFYINTEVYVLNEDDTEIDYYSTASSFKI